MAMISQRGVLRALPALFALLFALLFAPQVPALPITGPGAAGLHTSAADVASAAATTARHGAQAAAAQATADGPPVVEPEQAPPPAEAPPTVAIPGAPRALFTQHNTGPTGSRAPPSAA